MSNEQEVLDHVENKKYDYVEINHRIYERPELGNEEIFVSRTLIDQLGTNEFEVETDTAEHATGFITTYQFEKEGLTMGYLAEYDAPLGLGHMYGHNITGTVSILAEVTFKQVIDHIGGKVVVLGCSAEEGEENGSAEAPYIKAGVIDDIDITLMIYSGNEAYPTINTLAVDVLSIEFYSKGTHASENVDEVLNALDVVISYFNGVAQLRQQIKKSHRVHGMTLDGGKTANIMPDYMYARFYTRATARKGLDILTEYVNQITRGVVIQTGRNYEFGSIRNGVDEFIETPKLDELFRKYAIEVGKEVGYDDFGFSPTDTGNASHIAPTIHLHVKIGSRNLVSHTHRSRETVTSVHGDQVLIRGAKTITLMELELIENKKLFDEAMEQHSQVRG